MGRMDTQLSSAPQKKPWRVGGVAAGCALSWLTAELVDVPAGYAVAAVLILVVALIPVSKRRRPWLAALGAAATVTSLVALFIALLSGRTGPGALWLMVAAMAGLGLTVPLVFALTFPTTDARGRD